MTLNSKENSKVIRQDEADMKLIDNFQGQNLLKVPYNNIESKDYLN